MLKAIRRIQAWLIGRLRRPDPGQQIATRTEKLNEFLSWMTAKYFSRLASAQADSFASEPGARKGLKEGAEADFRDLLVKGIVHNLQLPARDGEEVRAWASHYDTLKQSSRDDTPGTGLIRRMISFEEYLRVLGEAFTDEQGDQRWRPHQPVFRDDLRAMAGSIQEIAITTPLRVFGGQVAVSREAESALLETLDLVEGVRREYGLDGPVVLHLDSARIRLHRNIAQANRYVWLPLRPLINAPLSGADLYLYARTDSTAELLARQVVRGDGVVLVTGYRGVGKSTLINRALETHLSKAEKAQAESPPWKIIPVVISLAKVEGVASALRLSVRRLAETLLEQPTPLAEHTLSRSLVANKPASDIPLLDDERELLSWAQIRVAFKVGTQQNASVTNTGAMRAGVGFQLGEIVGKKFLSGGLDLNAGREWQRKLNKTVELLEYDENHAEDDIARLIGMLARPRTTPDGRTLRLKMVFVFDEMDKMDEETGQEPLIKQLKNLFLTRNASFLLVTSKKLYYRWLDARRREDDILSSYFSSVIVVPIFTASETTQLVASLVDTAGEALSDREEAAVDILARYLTYRAMGVPREIVRELQTMQQWIPSSLQPYFSDRSDYYTRVRIYAEIQRSLEALDTDGAHPNSAADQSDADGIASVGTLDHLQLGEGRREQIRRGRYVLVEELLNHGNMEISEKSLNGIYKDNFAMVSTFRDFEQLVRQLAEQLDQFCFVAEDGPANDTSRAGVRFFQFIQPSTEDVASSNNIAPRLVVLRDFYELTGRPRPMISEPVLATPSANPIERLNTLLNKEGRFERQLAAGLLSGLRAQDLPSDFPDRLYRIFISPDETEELRVGAAAFVTPKAFADNIAREMPAAFIQSETNERVLNQFVELIALMDSPAQDAVASRLLLTLLERPTAGPHTPLPDSVAVNSVAALVQRKATDALERVVRALDPKLGAREDLLADLLTLAESSQKNLLLLLIERGFQNIPARMLQQIIHRYSASQLAELWPQLSKQSYKTPAAQSMSAILVALANPQAMVKDLTPTDLAPIIGWLGGSTWGYFEPGVLQAAHKADRRSLYALEKVVRELEDTEQRTRALHRLAIAQGKRPETPDSSSRTAAAPAKSSRSRRWVVLLAILSAVGALTAFVLVPFDLPVGVTIWTRLLDRLLQLLYLAGALIALVFALVAITLDLDDRRQLLTIALIAFLIAALSAVIAFLVFKLPFTWYQFALLGILVSAGVLPYVIVRVGNRLTGKS